MVHFKDINQSMSVHDLSYLLSKAFVMAVFFHVVVELLVLVFDSKNLCCHGRKN